MHHSVLKSFICIIMFLNFSVKPINHIIHVIQIVNLHTNKVSRILGKVENNERFLRIALYQGDKGNKKVRKIPSVAANVNDSKEPLSDPTLLCCAFKKHRIYLFRYGTQSSPESFSLTSSIGLHGEFFKSLLHLLFLRNMVLPLYYFIVPVVGNLRNLKMQLRVEMYSMKNHHQKSFWLYQI